MLSFVQLWDAVTGSLKYTFKGHCGDVNCSTFSPVDSNLIASCSADNTIKVIFFIDLRVASPSHQKVKNLFFRRFLPFIVPYQPYFSPLVGRISPRRKILCATLVFVLKFSIILIISYFILMYLPFKDFSSCIQFLHSKISIHALLPTSLSTVQLHIPNRNFFVVATAI